jgi:hypothetical protein
MTLPGLLKGLLRSRGFKKWHVVVAGWWRAIKELSAAGRSQRAPKCSGRALAGWWLLQNARPLVRAM